MEQFPEQGNGAIALALALLCSRHSREPARVGAAESPCPAASVAIAIHIQQSLKNSQTIIYTAT